MFRPWMLPVAFVGFGLLIALTFGYVQATVVKGFEFDTTTWTVRSFWYRRDPFSGSQMTGILREPPAGLNGVVANFPSSYFDAPSAVPARWDLIELRSGTAVTEGPAKVLYSYFEAYSAEQFWSNWSSAHVLKANVLWSAARDLVDLELYHELPKIMELAKVESTDAEFQELIEQQMRTLLTAYSEKLQKSTDTESTATKSTDTTSASTVSTNTTRADTIKLNESTLKRYRAAAEKSSKQ